MTSEILDVYRTLNKLVQGKIKKAREEYLAAKCEEIKILEKKF